MKARYKVIGFIVCVLACTGLLQRCNKPVTFTGPGKITLGGNSGNLITIKHRNPDTGKITKKRIFQPDPKSTVITTDAKGNVTVKVRQFGVGLEPGIGFGYSNKPRLALDARFVYYKRFGGHMGLGFNLDSAAYKGNAKLLDLVDPYIGISYVPFLRFSNTSVVASYTAAKRGFVFVRLRF